jgi:myo-inositol 2-dehydrogenase / D-chiro-inositol 1-dehydrogenase
VTGRAETLRVGVIGTGAMGASHVTALATSVPGAEVTVLHDFDGPRADRLAAEVGATAVASATELIGSDRVDAVVVASPDATHELLVLECLAARKPVLCEKPLALGVDGSQRIVDAEVVLGLRLVQVGFMRRYDSAYLALREAVLGGDLGTPRAVHCVHRNAHAQPGATSDGVIVGSMVHELDIVPWLVGDPLTGITVVAPARAGDVFADLQVAVLETASGVVATVEVFVNAGYGYDIGCEVVGSAGTARLTAPYGLARRRDGVDGREVAADFVERFADAYRVELAQWVRAASEGRVDGADAWAGHRANVAAAAGVQALRSGQKVGIDTEVPPPLYR